MRTPLLFVVLLSLCIVNAQDAIFDPSMSITPYGIVDSPFEEGVENIIDDDISTKFLDFELDDGMGFSVNLGGASARATSIEMTTANDFEARDPTSVEILGSTNGASYTSIATIDIPCVMDRFFTRTFDFDNTESYSYYRVDYGLACDPSGGDGIPSIQVAETQLYTPILGVDDESLASSLSLYPNPSNGVFTFAYGGNQSLKQALIVDINGRIIQSIDLSNFSLQQEINLVRLETGLYFLKVQSEKASASIKLIIS